MTECCADGCGRPAVYTTKKLCRTHYVQLSRYGRTYRLRRSKSWNSPNGYRLVHAPSHPLARRDGSLLEHRKVAYDERGGLIDKCERCGLVSIDWDTCHVDHDDNNRQNNSPSNLLVTCNGCNTMRGTRRGGLQFTCRGETKSAIAWANDPRVKVTSSTILKRKKRGQPDEEAVFGRRKTHIHTETQRPNVKFVGEKRVRA